MNDFLQANMVPVVTVLCILSRLADIGTTYLVSPTLKLEANVIVRRFRWKYAWLTVLVGFVPYWSMPAGIMLMTVSFFVASSNASKILMSKALGEEGYSLLATRVMMATPPGLGWFYLLLPAGLFAIPGGVLFMFAPDPRYASYWFAQGIVAYAIIVAFWSSVRYFRLRKVMRQQAVD